MKTITFTSPKALITNDAGEMAYVEAGTTGAVVESDGTFAVVRLAIDPFMARKPNRITEVIAKHADFAEAE